MLSNSVAYRQLEGTSTVLGCHFSVRMLFVSRYVIQSWYYYVTQYGVWGLLYVHFVVVGVERWRAK